MQNDRLDMVTERFFNPLDRDPFFLVGKSPFLRIPAGPGSGGDQSGNPHPFCAGSLHDLNCQRCMARDLGGLSFDPYFSFYHPPEVR